MKIKVRITLKNLKPEEWEDATLVLYNDVFDVQNGIAFFPIETKKWEVINSQLFSGMVDVDEFEIYAGDVVEGEAHSFQRKAVYRGEVIFDMGCFSLQIHKVVEGESGYDLMQAPPLYDFANLKILK